MCLCLRSVRKCVSYRNSPNGNWLQSKPHLFVVKILDCKNLSSLIPIWMRRHESKPSPVSMYRAWYLSYKRKDVDNFHFQWIFVILSRLDMRSNHRGQIADWWFHWMVPMEMDPAMKHKKNVRRENDKASLRFLNDKVKLFDRKAWTCWIKYNLYIFVNVWNYSPISTFSCGKQLLFEKLLNQINIPVLWWFSMFCGIFFCVQFS